ncbi:DUF2407 C-terminal domain-containing protein [Cantharellus anzutake]|uniref:DUF2407 C-terminal domain-containing protein n=1 Tax=Cantharellus anzutake TaxID=1750568 RepID=UPI001907314D|nr:DUF2407 C-terminal domain-containing protein [Cantharellus anzutake]KAF8327474.1 DUF2407 C-terminal domain-containing protein [Cantharellus anzutake]
MSAPTPVLSEKAKGKRKAIPQDSPDHDGENSKSHQAVAPRSFTVRFSEGLGDLSLSVSPDDTVREVLRKIKVERPSLARRRLRLIHSGRLLTNGTKLHGWIASLEERQKRSLVLGPKSSEDGGVWVHCSVGPEIPASELDDESVQRSQISPLKGFDRLQAAGLSEEEIANIRRQFHATRGGDTNSGGALQDDDQVEHARALEEQWIDDLDGAASTAESCMSFSHIYSTLLFGMLLGFFFPLLPFYFMRSPRPAVFFSDSYQALESQPSVVFSTRMCIAIVFGFVANIAYGSLRVWNITYS